MIYNDLFSEKYYKLLNLKEIYSYNAIDGAIWCSLNDENTCMRVGSEIVSSEF